MKTVSATEFKSRCLALIDEVQRTGHRLLITRHGKPVVEIGPSKPASSMHSNPLRDSILYQDDLLSPIAQTWDNAP